MNRLSTERRGQVVSLLCEGMCIRSIMRVTGVAKNTVTKVLVDLGAACAEYQDAVLTNLRPSRIVSVRVIPQPCVQVIHHRAPGNSVYSMAAPDAR
jgi:hypothetical protein